MSSFSTVALCVRLYPNSSKGTSSSTAAIAASVRGDTASVSSSSLAAALCSTRIVLEGL